MGLRLILGRAGSGKSTLIYKEINELVAADPGGKPLWLLVPEQATSQAERDLATTGPVPGIMRARVVSFQRLAYQMLHEVAGAARVQVGELGRHMIIRRVVEQHKQELRTFYRAAQQPGFVRKLAELISELKSCQITPADLTALLEAQADRLTPTLQNKLHDLALLCNHLAEQYGDTYLDTGDCLNLLAENLAKSPSLAGSQIWLDGFNGFTPQEYAVIAQMLLACPQVSVSLTMPPQLLRHRVRDDHVFYSPWETAHRLMQLASDLGVAIAPPVVPAEQNLRSQTNEALQYLERNYFNPLARPYPEPPEKIKVVAAGNRRAEVEAAAAEILRLCREENYRYRDISITLRDFADYDYLLTTVLTDFGIPHFLDRKRKVDQHPALELVRSALETVLENFLYEPVFRCLKTDLFPCQRDAIDLLENYVLAMGIRGSSSWLDNKDWIPPQDMTDSGAGEAINTARRMVATHLGQLAQALKEGTTARDYTVALYNFLDGLQVESQLLAWAEKAANEGELEAASLHTLVWSALVGLLDELVAGVGQEELPLAEYARIVDSGLEAIELGLIPPELDQVIITSLGRSRNPEVKAALVLGVSEGVLPARTVEDGLLTEHERQQLASCNLELGLS
ncbi:MAG: helicase-exonuclease AddAB subunit AddB, partial [Firmicutes bacterium]|nr:helicase-exonuclease AddAB subunit AddB [Bacillota bacterium]